MTTKTTRRRVLAGMAGGATVAAVPSAGRAAEPVIGLVDEAEAALDVYLDAREIARTVREKADNDPDCPEWGWEIAEGLKEGTYDFGEINRQQIALMKEHWRKHGVDQPYARWNAAGDEFRPKALLALRAPVSSVEGIAAKVRLVSDMEAYDDDPEMVIERTEWLAILARDLGSLS